ncbi:GUN4 domain-containing protein [Calothrix sp. FACHB-1219]|uniref:caspase, EACC1-associated type n=1 Tax=unclassified Calothrix TaxID=2619626 RepID=UPI001684FED6|nr:MULTISPECIES: GUN4 domain-containing protein [unclassified Calothrix]MBD2201287.1 GUN4 domain-containing protein [Calothrix sp. FACHB-168]MBD2215721.1 GUN4 domain-containing protein [Calothrix sp. FACHB-1219]
MAKKIALLIGVGEYGEGIPPLSSALNDVEAMERVLQNPNLGGFEQVERLLNPDAIAMRKAIQNLFKQAYKDDLVLFFFSGHGITNDQDHLYLATRNTAKDDFEATAVDASFIQRQSYNCYAKRQVLILDACYSGAYAQGWRAKSASIDIKKQLGAEGRVVLTSSSATQTSFEQEGATLSLYTQYLVEGIETGAADKDSDGKIYVQELHDYAKAKVQAVKPKMIPGIIQDKEAYNLVLAYAPKNPEAEYRKLVEQYARNGELNEFAFLVLKPKRKTFGLTDEKAEEIETEVLEPFRRRLVSLESYKQAFAKAVEQKYPLDEHILKILKDYQQDVLGLRDQDVKSIELEIKSVKEAEYQKQVQREKEQYGNNLRRYEQEFTKAVQAQYPLDEYVRNELKQFQKSLGLKDEDVKRVEERIRPRKTQKEQKLRSEKGVDYTKLCDLLAAGKWKDADEETLAVMLKATGREKDGWLNIESIENFPCTDLRTIDQLWVKYSNGRYGFSVQRKIWLEVGKNENAFYTRVGWQISGKWLNGGWIKESSIKYDFATWYAPVGHLPTSHCFKRPAFRVVGGLFSRVETCEL